MVLAVPLAGREAWERGGGKVKLWVLPPHLAPLHAGMGQLLPFPELPKFPAAIPALAAHQGLSCSRGGRSSGRRGRAHRRPSLSALFLCTGMVLFVFKRVPPVRLSLRVSSKLCPVLADLHALASDEFQA